MIRLTEHDGVEMGEDGEYVEIDTTSDAFRTDAILNASDYLLRYRQGTSDASQTLDNLPQLDVAALTSVWPHGKFRARKSGKGTNNAEKAEFPMNAGTSLTAASMRTVIEGIVQGDPSDVELLAEAEQVPGFTESLRAFLLAIPKSVQGKHVRTLLGHIHRKCPLVDFYPFSHLCFEDILETVKIAAGSRDAFSLAIPGLEDLTADNLCRLLSNGLIHGMRLGQHQTGISSNFLTSSTE